MVYDEIKRNIKLIKEESRSYDALKEHELFTILCAKYYFFYDESFSNEAIMEYITDGKDDGGFDAVFNDPNSEGNDVIIVQSKYYSKTKVYDKNIVAELFKINHTMTELNNNNNERYNRKLITAYRDAVNNMEEGGRVRVYFFTSYTPSSKADVNKMNKDIESVFPSGDIEIVTGQDILDQITLCEAGKICVEFDKLEIDNCKNILRHEDSAIVNISAKSLHSLFLRRKNRLFGLNLRYFVKQKDVDKEIQNSIKKDSSNFWYKNNGIVIICDDYNISGNEIKLEQFSIINGGQTTNLIGSLNIVEDFYLHCKIIKRQRDSEEKMDAFTSEIAKATNSQKAIKIADLRANSPEQIKLKSQFSNINVLYITKRGETVGKKSLFPYQVTKLEQVGKISLATIMQMPGSARSNSKIMHEAAYYGMIFRDDVRVGVIADALKIDYYFKNFVKKDILKRGYNMGNYLPMYKNGATFLLASIAYLSKIVNGVFTFNEIDSYLKARDYDGLKIILRKKGDLERIINNKLDNEEQIFYEIFEVIVEEVLVHAFDKSNVSSEILEVSNYLKKDYNYYSDILDVLRFRYSNNRYKLKENIDLICGKI